MPNQNLEIFIEILVIDVMMSSIRSSSFFNVNVPGWNNKIASTFNNFICLLTWPISKREDNDQQNVDIAGRFWLTPYPLQEKNAFVSSIRPRSLSNFSTTERKPLPMFDVASCAYDTLMGPELPWVEFVEICWYVSAYKKATVSSKVWK